MQMTRQAFVPFLLAAGALVAEAQQRPAPPATVQAPASPQRAATGDTADRTVETLHTARIGGAEVRYTATVGRLVLRHPSGRPRAHMFFTYYRRDGQDPKTRPIMFTYNGGPGSPSIWLHMGLMGPKRVQMGTDGFQPAPPYTLVDNVDSPLDVTDIVMIDPVQTGYSRAAEGEDVKQFTGVRQDVESVGEFIRLFTTKFTRWPSPKYLLGESYGTMRSAGLAAELQNRHGMELNGIVLVSSILDYQSKGYVAGNDYPYANFLPSFTASAWYHRKLPPDLQALTLEEAVQRSRDFAYGPYFTALVKGTRLQGAERSAIAQQVARYSGLSADFVARANLRVSDQRFRKELLRDRALTIGRLDGRYTGRDVDAAGETQEYDPANEALGGPYTALFMDYVRRELKWETDLPYFTSGQVQPWDYSPYSNRYLNMVENLRSAMARNPFLKVMVANGYYDFATPFAATEHTFDHLGMESSYSDRVTLKYYEGGHMMYIHPKLLTHLKHDLAAFITSTQVAR
ncbi:MAG: peptidase S10 [Gemmatimonadaceae bacterium]